MKKTNSRYVKRVFLSELSGLRVAIASRLSRTVAGIIAFLFVLAIPIFFIRADSDPAAAPLNISGFWELHYDSRNIPKAALTKSAALVTADEKAKNTTHVVRWCILVGMPAMMDSDAPIDIEQDSKAIGIISGVVSGPRTIYLDGRKHPNMDIFDDTTVGDSIGHWEGDTLVVDTVGFSDKGIIDIPGGGMRTPGSHLIERYRLLDNGKRLLVTSTWTDPKIFTRPHTYALLYYRAAPGYRPRDTDCDASDKLRADFLESPPHE